MTDPIVLLVHVLRIVGSVELLAQLKLFPVVNGDTLEADCFHAIFNSGEVTDDLFKFEKIPRRPNGRKVRIFS